MASTGTTNLGIEKPATGDRSGTWGTMTNTNMDLIDQAVAGIAQIAISSPATVVSPHDINITDFTVSDGRNKFIEFTSAPSAATAYVRLTPDNAEKIGYFRNSTGQTVILFQGTYNASNDLEIPDGKDVVVKFSGIGTASTVTNLFTDLVAGNITAPVTGNVVGNVTGNLTGNVTGNVTGALTGNVTGNLTGNVTGNVTSTGSSSFSSVTLSGGTINNMQIGASTAAAGTFTGITVTGTATLATANIDAGDIDGTTVGGTTPGAGTFTTLQTTGDNVLIQTSQTPASASASGTAGEIAWDTNYIYVCVATNTWKRVLISTW